MLSSKDPGEVVVVTWDFTALATTVQSPLVSCNWVFGQVDFNAASMLIGAPQVQGSRVLQLVRGGVNGANYDMRCTAQASDGSLQTWVLADILPVYTET